ncbi:cobalamin biosynthesis protein, partial [Arthrospira platensis SPKY1]|nr:cobalamin biosynthesis protein [Arthrospira platensis SPKY1]
VTALLCLGAVLLDRWRGELRQWHPLVGFGQLAQRVEALAYGSPELSARDRRQRGIGAVILLLVPFTVAAWLLATIPLLGLAVALGLLYLTLGARSLKEHAEAVAAALQTGDLPLARARVALIVSRDTDDLD